MSNTKFRQKELFDSSQYVTVEGLNLVYARLVEQSRESLATGDRVSYERQRQRVGELKGMGKRVGLSLPGLKDWETAQRQWADRANCLIGKLYKKMAAIPINEIGLEEADAKRQRLQKRLNLIGKIAARRGQLFEDDGYEWMRDGSGRLKPRLPLYLR